MTATVTDKLIAKAKELGLPPQTETFLRQADGAVTEAVRRAGDYTVGNRDKIAQALDKAGRAVDEKTQGKYSDTIGKARAQAERGLDKIVEKAQASSSASATATDAAGSTHTGSEPATAAGSGTGYEPATGAGSTGTEGAESASGQDPAQAAPTAAQAPPKPVWAEATDPMN